jgi:16S rRNA (cytidine1402-2'-O)-methyltransferase
MSGTLYVVGTPIGHLGDITRRAVETLKIADRIVAEDTRRTRALLSHLGISGKPLQCVQAHSDASRIRRVVEYLLQGQSVALVTDAGMPGISDPGAHLIAEATATGVNVQVVPGPSAVTAALSVSGIAEGPFYFLGFLPREGKRRKSSILRVTLCPDAVVLFESPHRIQATLCELAQQQPSRQAVLCRELTKLHEEVTRGTLQDLADRGAQSRGEFVLVLGAQDIDQSSDSVGTTVTDEVLLNKLAQGQSPRTILHQMGLVGQSRRELYARLIRLAERPAADTPEK